MNAAELALHRKGTRDFINRDKTTLVLYPSNEVWVAGTKEFADVPPRPPQDFKVIYPGADSGGKTATDEGTETARYDFILVGNWDATVAIGDHWSEGEQTYVVEWVQPYNEYEVKAGGVSHGNTPAHG
ncbi:hypothetical protein HWB99_gp026 [Mycobacterium phage DrLupo]|uniref:Head-to-tail stopper n=1 Tax=Mycobacterium phage DrLupo TaxID=2499037 RepID=A0A3S9UQK7_9CAUD|nr:hypothetical protein HWB99_gp026 [Mycobacterium phage DrLupo]AZS12562.1 hypothetical protein SEA_DRLUPO_26 [Mycobacterium phage DrLupo]